MGERLAALPGNSHLRVAVHPARQITPPEPYVSPMWSVRMAPHAEPRVGMPRSISHDGNLSKDSAATARRGLSMAAPPPPQDGATAAAAPAAAPAASVPTSPAQSMRTPFGYVKGAICVEPPKRQRTGGSTYTPRSPSVSVALAVPQPNPAPA